MKCALIPCVFVALGVAGAEEAQRCTMPSSAEPLAKLDSELITKESLKPVLDGRLLKLRTEEFSVLSSVLDQEIDDRLLKDEAKSRGVTVEALLREEVVQQIPTPSAAEVRAVYDVINRDQSASGPDERSLALAADQLRSKRIAAKRKTFVATLRSKHDIQVLLQPPRVRIGMDRARAIKGPADALVTIVVFSEFECPYCRQHDAVLKRVQAAYPAGVRVVFRQYPLPMHRYAGKAAEASLCAAEQDQFWSMHDLMFQNQRDLDVTNLQAYALTVGLDMSKFRECLYSGRMADSVAFDRSLGDSVGVASTPTTFVNGRMLVGAVPFEIVSRVVLEEMQGGGISVKTSSSR